jgi:hypothetical protein
VLRLGAETHQHPATASASAGAEACFLCSHQTPLIAFAVPPSCTNEREANNGGRWEGLVAVVLASMKTCRLFTCRSELLDHGVALLGINDPL